MSEVVPPAAESGPAREPEPEPPGSRTASSLRSGKPAEPPDAGEEPEPSPDQLEHEVETIRDRLGGLVSELDHRRHRLNPIPMLRRNSLALAVGGAVVVGLLAGGIAWRVTHEARRQRTLAARAARLRRAIGGALAEARGTTAHARPPATTPSLARKVLTAALSAAAVVAARRLTQKATEEFFKSAPVQTADPRS